MSRGDGFSAHDLKLEQLSKFFHLPIAEAAKEIGVCTTVLKKICRRNEIPRWPHRKIKSIDKMISTLEEQLGKNPDDDHEIRKELITLKKHREYVMKNPSSLVKYKRKSSHIRSHHEDSIPPQTNERKKIKVEETSTNNVTPHYSFSEDHTYNINSDYNIYHPSSDEFQYYQNSVQPILYPQYIQSFGEYPNLMDGESARPFYQPAYVQPQMMHDPSQITQFHSGDVPYMTYPSHSYPRENTKINMTLTKTTVKEENELNEKQLDDHNSANTIKSESNSEPLNFPPRKYVEMIDSQSPRSNQPNTVNSSNQEGGVSPPVPKWYKEDKDNYMAMQEKMGLV